MGVETVKKTAPQLISLILFFGMLWLPLGHHHFLVEHWMKLGTFMVPALLFMYFNFRSPKEQAAWNNKGWISLVMLIAYIIHQFEEHWIDIFGNYYAFWGNVNGLLKAALGIENLDSIILTKEGVFIINTSLVWLVGFIAILFSSRSNFPSFALSAIILVNAISHILAGILKVAYNPGLLTSILIFLPISIRYYQKAFSKNKRLIFYSILWAVTAHIVMILGTVFANAFHLFPEYIYFAALIFWSILPAFLFQRHNDSF